MMAVHYFAGLCFFWAAIGIGSRVAMAVMGERWAQWELNSAYTARKPLWLYGVGVVGAALIGLTWVLVLTTDVPHSWIIAVLISLTGIKLYTLLFDYDRFRGFVQTTLADRGRMRALNIGVLVLSGVLVAMGIWLY